MLNYSMTHASGRTSRGRYLGDGPQMMLVALSRPGMAPRWTDDTTPRTDRPFHFIPRAKGRARARIIRQGWDPNSFTIRFSSPNPLTGG